MHYFVALSALVAIAWAEPVNAQQVKAGVLTCDVSEGMGYIIGSQKRLSCSFAPEGAGRREDYDGSITKFGLDLGLTRGGFMVWSVFTNTVAGPGFLAGDYVGASGEVEPDSAAGGKTRRLPAAAAFEYFDEHDRKQREDLSRAVTESTDKARAFLNSAQAETAMIIDSRWQQVVALAGELALRG
jgi:hypothetical protein